MLQVDAFRGGVQSARRQGERAGGVARALRGLELVDDHVGTSGFRAEGDLAAFLAHGGRGVDAGDLEFAVFHGFVGFGFFGFEG